MRILLIVLILCQIYKKERGESKRLIYFSDTYCKQVLVKCFLYNVIVKFN